MDLFLCVSLCAIWQYKLFLKNYIFINCWSALLACEAARRHSAAHTGKGLYQSCEGEGGLGSDRCPDQDLNLPCQKFWHWASNPGCPVNTRPAADKRGEINKSMGFQPHRGRGKEVVERGRVCVGLGQARSVSGYEGDAWRLGVGWGGRWLCAWSRAPPSPRIKRLIQTSL